MNTYMHVLSARGIAEKSPDHWFFRTSEIHSARTNQLLRLCMVLDMAPCNQMASGVHAGSTILPRELRQQNHAMIGIRCRQKCVPGLAPATEYRILLG